MSLKRRLNTLEGRAGIGDPESEFCTCPGDDKVVFEWSDGEIEPETCPKCGRPIKTVEVTWETGIEL